MRRPLRWGIAGCGKIAEDFAAALTTVPGAQLAAAASSSSGLNSLERAQVLDGPVSALVGSASGVMAAI